MKDNFFKNQHDKRSTTDKVASKMFWFVILPLIVLLFVLAQIYGA